MKHLVIPLSDKEETIVQLLRKINQLEYENRILKEEIRELKCKIMEQDYE
jgi:hypothetical protein